MAIMPHSLPNMFRSLPCIEACKQVNNAKIVDNSERPVLFIGSSEATFILVEERVLLLRPLALHVLERCLRRMVSRKVEMRTCTISIATGRWRIGLFMARPIDRRDQDRRSA